MIISSKALLFAKKVLHTSKDGPCDEILLDAIPLYQVDEIRINNLDDTKTSMDTKQKKRSQKPTETTKGSFEKDNDLSGPDSKKLVRLLNNQNGSFIQRVGRAISATNLSYGSGSKTQVELDQDQCQGTRFINTIEIKTDVHGYNSGRIYFIRMASEDECLRIRRLLSELSARSRQLYETQTRLQV